MAQYNSESSGKFSKNWGYAVFIIFCGWFLFVAANVYITQHFRNQDLSTSMLILDYSFMFFVLLTAATVVSFLVGKGVRKYRSIPNVELVLKAFWVSAIFLALLTYGDYEAESRKGSSSPQVEDSEEIAKVTAVITRQTQDGLDSMGYNLDARSTAALEDWLVEMTISKLRNQYLEMGLAQPDFTQLIQSSSASMNIEGQDLAIIKITLDDTLRMVAIFGIENGEVTKVSCNRNSDHEISVFSGICGDKIHEAFGIRISP